MRILVVDDSTERAGVVTQGLAGAGHEIVWHGEAAMELLQAVERLGPDVIIVGADSVTRDTLEGVALMSSGSPRPIVMFVDQSDDEAMRAAIGSGVAAYVVDGLDPSRIRSIVDVAVARFGKHRELIEELSEARLKLAERPIIERAKALLIKRRGLSEEEAFKLLRGTAMKRQQKLVEVAQHLLDAADLIG